MRVRVEGERQSGKDRGHSRRGSGTVTTTVNSPEREKINVSPGDFFFPLYLVYSTGSTINNNTILLLQSVYEHPVYLTVVVVEKEPLKNVKTAPHSRVWTHDIKVGRVSSGWSCDMVAESDNVFRRRYSSNGHKLELYDLVQAQVCNSTLELKRLKSPRVTLL